MPDRAQHRPSVTTWLRLEPRCVSADSERWSEVFQAQLESQVHDPLWLLARQWQVREFQGEDTATPVLATLSTIEMPLTDYQLGGGRWRPMPGVAEVWNRAGVAVPAQLPGQRAMLYALPLPGIRVEPGDALFVDLEVVSGCEPWTGEMLVTWLDPHGSEHDATIAVPAGQGSAGGDRRLQIPAAAVGLDGRVVSAVRVCLPERVAISVTAVGRRRAGSPVPLEVLVERDTADDRDLRWAAEAGLYLFAVLARHLDDAGRARLGAYRAAYLREFPLTCPAADELDPLLDPASRRQLTVLAGRAPDGVRLAKVLRGDAATAPNGGAAVPDLLDRLGIAVADRTAVSTAHTDWLGWCDGLIDTAPPDDPPAWDPARLAYRFAVRTPLNGSDPVVTLRADDYDGELDWYSVDATVTPPPPQQQHDPTRRLRRTRHRILTELAYPGMPRRRFWEFEDARVDFGALAAAPGDIARLLVAGFAMDYGNDWYLLPLSLRVGSVVTINSLTVSDTFGGTVPADPYGDGPSGALFRLSGAPGGMLLLPPVLASGRLHAEPVEEVRLVRDETVNLAFAVELAIASRTGRPLRRDEAPPPAVPDPAATDPRAELVYRLREDPPAHWIALEPRPPEGSLLDIRAVPLGRILDAARNGLSRAIHEEELRVDGRTVTRAYEYGRSPQGTTHVWMGRRTHPSGRTASSGLRFDAVDPHGPTSAQTSPDSG